MSHTVLAELLAPISALYEDVRRKALMRLEYEGLHRAEAITTPGARYYNSPAAYAMDRYAYYVCFKCNKVILCYCFSKNLIQKFIHRIIKSSYHSPLFNFLSLSVD